MLRTHIFEFGKAAQDGESEGDLRISVGHMWSLPGLSCETCDTTWSRIGVDYPAVDLADLGAEAEVYRDNSPVGWQEYRRRRDRLREVLGPEVELEPGVGFGPLIGVATGRFADLVWATPWTPLIDRRTLDRLRAMDVRLQAVPTQIASPSDEIARFLELVIWPGIRFARAPGESAAQARCPTCGVAIPSPERKAAELAQIRAIARGEPVEPSHFTLDASSFTAQDDLFRTHDRGIILATERLREAMQSLGVENVQFRPVEVEGCPKHGSDE